MEVGEGRNGRWKGEGGGGRGEDGGGKGEDGEWKMERGALEELIALAGEQRNGELVERLWELVGG